MIWPVTPRQADLLRFIQGYQVTHGGASPSYADCARALGLHSKSSVYRMMTGLAQRGRIRHQSYAARTIEVLAPLSLPTAPDGTPLYAVPMPALRDRA